MLFAATWLVLDPHKKVRRKNYEVNEALLFIPSLAFG